MLHEKYLVLTLAVEQAVADENWDEVQTLFRERSETMFQLDSITPQYRSQIEEIEARYMKRLTLRRKEVLDQLRKISQASKLRATYAAANAA